VLDAAALAARLGAALTCGGFANELKGIWTGGDVGGTCAAVFLTISRAVA